MQQDKLDLFNWYIVENVMCGDIVVSSLRHNEFIKEKSNYTQPNIIHKRDQKYLESHPNCSERECKFVQFRLDSTTLLQYNLVNMDSFFYLNEKKQEYQLGLLKSFTHQTI